MKRSEANAIQRARTEWSAKYTCLSCAHETCEPYLSAHGCDVCNSLPTDVHDVTFLATDDIGPGKPNVILEGQMCNGCLCAIVNGDDSDLDYYTTEEDVPREP